MSWYSQCGKLLDSRCWYWEMAKTKIYLDTNVYNRPFVMRLESC